MKQLTNLNLDKPSYVSIYLQNSIKRSMVEDLIKEKYMKVHNASFSKFMTYILAIESTQRLPIAGMGFQPAKTNTLFCEQYLKDPIEKTLSRKSTRIVRRQDIIEIGNLGGNFPGVGRLLIASFLNWTSDTPFQWVVFTATRKMYAVFKKLNITPLEINPALRENLQGDYKKDNWGKYYDDDPKVFYFNLPEARSHSSNIINLYTKNLKFNTLSETPTTIIDNAKINIQDIG